jgi:hypothetical protein
VKTSEKRRNGRAEKELAKVPDSTVTPVDSTETEEAKASAAISPDPGLAEPVRLAPQVNLPTAEPVSVEPVNVEPVRPSPPPVAAVPTRPRSFVDDTPFDPSIRLLIVTLVFFVAFLILLFASQSLR